LTFELSISCPSRSTRQFQVPNRKFADAFTVNSLMEAEEASDFVRRIEDRLRTVDLNIMKKVKRKPFRRELLQRLLPATEENEDLKMIVNDYRKEKAEDNETLRFSHESKEAFVFLNKISKYHEYNKRDGSVVSKVIDAPGNLVLDKSQVHQEIINALRKMQVKEDEPVYSVKEPFPMLEEPSEEEMLDMIRQLSTNKALAFDGVTYILFNKEWREITSNKLKNLWSALAQEKNILQVHFDQRLLPLNRIHPHVPKPRGM